MPTLLVINRDDTWLPPGWVSAILPAGVEPSEYERSGYLWKAVETPLSPAKEKSSFPPGPLLGGLLYEPGRVRRVDAAAHLAARKHAQPALKRIAGPGHLDRSHSTVWDYGPGRTYSTPQAAFDALLLQEGSDPFTETHYLRGWSGIYYQGPLTVVLGIHTVNPTNRFPLIVEAAPGADVRFDDEGGPAAVAGMRVSHVHLFSFRLSGAGWGIIPTAEQAGKAVNGWRVEECEVDGSAEEMQMGICLYQVDYLSVRRCRFHHLSSAALGTIRVWPDESPHCVEMSNSLIWAAHQGVATQAPSSLLLINNTICSQAAAISHSSPHPLALIGMLNNIFAGPSPDFIPLETIELPAEELTVMRSDGNCFQPAPNGALARLVEKELDLAGWQEHFHQDEHSLACDPNLDEEFKPRLQSPCRRAGLTWDRTGLNGLPRAFSIDAGAFQVTRPVLPGIQPRQAPEIRRR